MMRRVALVLLVLALGGWRVSPVAADGRVIAVIPHDSPPTYFQDHRDGGKAAGFAVEVMDLVAARAGLEVEYRFASDWSAIIAEVKRGGPM